MNLLVVGLVAGAGSDLAVADHAGGSTFADDVTVLIARRVEISPDGEESSMTSTVEALL